MLSCWCIRPRRCRELPGGRTSSAAALRGSSCHTDQSLDVCRTLGTSCDRLIAAQRPQSCAGMTKSGANVWKPPPTARAAEVCQALSLHPPTPRPRCRRASPSWWHGLGRYPHVPGWGIGGSRPVEVDNTHRRGLLSTSSRCIRGLLRELSPGPLAPEARIMPLDKAASCQHLAHRSSYCSS